MSTFPALPAWASGAPDAVAAATTGELEAVVASSVEPAGSARTKVTNWGGTFTARGARVFSPTSIAQCIALVELARRADVELRAVGSAHSPSDVMLTGQNVREPVPPRQPGQTVSAPRAIRRTRDGWLLRMDRLSGFIGVEACDPVSTLAPGPPGHAANQGPPSIEVLSGTQIHDVHQYLATAGPAPLALSSVGSISDQTIGGLISTGTHGSGLRFPLVAAYVLELTLIVPRAQSQGGTQLVHCSRTDQPELFNASLCGLGATGLITHVKLAAEPAFQLHQLAEDVYFDALFGKATGFPAARSPDGASIGSLLAAGKRLPSLHDPPVIDGTERSKGPNYIFPFVAVKGSTTVGTESEETLDEETTRAQKRFEELAQCTQHLRLFWYPQVGTVSVLRADRTGHAPESPSFLSRLYGKAVDHTLTEGILYISRFHRKLPLTAVKLWYWITHRRLPKDAPQSLDDELTIARAKGDKPSAPLLSLEGIDQDMASFARPAGTASTAARRAEAYSSFHGAVIPSLGDPVKGDSLPGWITPRDHREHLLPLHPSHPTAFTTDISYRTFNMDCLFAQYTSEWSIPFAHTAAALRAMRDWLNVEHASPHGARLHWPVEIRVGAPDGVWLSTSYGRATTYIGVVLYRPYGANVPYRTAFAKFDALMRHYAGRPHWAKQHPLSPVDLAKLYPHFDDWRRVRDEADPDQVFVNPYLRRHVLGEEVNDTISPRVFKARL